MSSRLEGSAKRLSAYVSEREIYNGKPLYQALVDQARVQGIAGTTVFRGVGGFGRASREVERHGLRMSSDLPVVVQAVDDIVRITALAEVWGAMIHSGMVTCEDVNVLVYCGDCDPSRVVGDKEVAAGASEAPEETQPEGTSGE